ncbi:unnamed protein product [Closterium sp. NIES-53]
MRLLPIFCGRLRSGTLRISSTSDPVSPCRNLANTALDGGGWRCIGVLGLGSRALVHDTSTDKLSARAIPCVFHSFPPDAPGWEFYHPTSRRVLPSQDVTFDESVPFYYLFPYLTAPLPPRPLFLAPAVDSCAAWGGATRGAASGGAEPAGAKPGGTAPACTEPGVAEYEGAEPGGAEPERAEPGGADPERNEPGGTLSIRGPRGTLLRREPLSPPQLCEWFTWRTRLRSGAAKAGGPATGGTGAGAAGGTRAAGHGGARTGGTGAAGAGGAAGVDTGGTGAAGAGGAAGVGAGGTIAGAARGTRAAGPGGARTRGTGAAGSGGAGCVGVGNPGAGCYVMLSFAFTSVCLPSYVRVLHAWCEHV